MDSRAPLIVLEGVSKSYGALPILKGVTLSLRPGTISILAGGNGSGKSTLMRIMAGLVRPDSGTVTRNIDPAGMGYMAHDTFLYPALTAMENLLFWARAAGILSPEARAREALSATGLARRAEERAGIFSRGMAQRLNLARLIMGDPRLILLDEPSTGLDVPSRSLLREIMTDFRSRGAAIAWISHDLEEDSGIADAVLTIRRKTLSIEERSRPC
ncbi:MAG: ABC transporter ATP-binding protein [Mailhella sp.]|nr:ABC transporter ATP-binding protein [Mailhella sp.]